MGPIRLTGGASLRTRVSLSSRATAKEQVDSGTSWPKKAPSTLESSSSNSSSTAQKRVKMITREEMKIIMRMKMKMRTMIGMTKTGGGCDKEGPEKMEMAINMKMMSLMKMM